MIRRTATAASMAGLATFLGASAMAGPDAAAIIRKASAPMKTAKTYQAKWRMVMSMGDMGTMSMDMDMKTTSDGKAYVTTTPVGTPTGMMAMGAAMASTTTVSDGKTVYIYLKGMNAYQKMPAPKDRNPGVKGVLGNIDQKGVTYAYAGTEMVRGKKCHVIKITPPSGQQGPRPGMKQDIRAYVDVNTNHLQQVKTVVTMPMGPGGPNAGAGQSAQPKPMVMTTTMVLIKETLNAPIPPGLFTFTPPKGATEMKGGMMGPGMPGVGGPPVRGPQPPGR